MENRRRRSACYLIALVLLFLSGSSSYAGSDFTTVQVSLIVLPFMSVELASESLFFTIDPDALASDTVTVQAEVCSNAPPTSFGIALFTGIAGLQFSYRLVGVGADTVAILPIVSWQNLPSLGCTTYMLELTATAGPNLSSGSYQADVQLQFQGAGVIRIYTLHLDITVLARTPMVDAGRNQTVSEGDTVAFTGSFNDPDVGETYTISWDFGDGAAGSGTLIPTHTYNDNGTYTVTLTVTDSGGRAGQDAVDVTVNDLGPTAHVESVPPVIPPLAVAVDDELTLDASGSTSSPDAIVSYEWDWNYVGLVFEPSGDAGETVTHAFEEAGTYTIAVRVTDDDGSTDTATLEVGVILTPVTTTEVGLATPEVAGAGGAAVPEVAIDEVYVHQQALAASQFHLVSAEAPETPSNPVIHFPFDEGGGEYAYNEIDRQSNRDPILEGTLYQVEWIEGAMGPENHFALSLGEDGHVKIPPDPRMSFSWNQDFTLELWVRTTDSVTERPLVRRQGLDSGSLYGLNLLEGAPLFYTSAAVDYYAIVKGSKNIADGAWHHIACMRKNGTLKLHVDGELVDELAPEMRIAGVGGGNLSSDEPAYFGGLVKEGECLGGLVDASYRIGETIEFRMRITDETGAPVTDAAPSLLFIRYNYGGQKVSSGFVGRLTCDADNEKYAYSLDTSTYEQGIYDFFFVPDDGSQHRLRIMLLEME